MFKPATLEGKDCWLVFPKQDQTKSEYDSDGQMLRAWLTCIQSISHSDEMLCMLQTLTTTDFL